MQEDFNITVLKYFLAVAETNSITRAANELFITQPTLSRQLCHLEEQLGTSLFIRKKHGVELTADGVLFLKECRKFFQAYESFKTASTSLHTQGLMGSLSVIYLKSARSYLSAINKHFLVKNPNVHIHCITSTNTPKNFVDILLSGEVDCAYLYSHELKNTDRSLIDSVNICRLKFGVLLSATNPLASKKQLFVRDLVDQQFVLPNRIVSPVKIEEVFNACRLNGFTPNVIEYLDNVENIMVNIESYGTISIMPEYVYHFDSNDNVLFRVLEDYPYQYEICLATLASNPNPAVYHYIEFVRSSDPDFFNVA